MIFGYTPSRLDGTEQYFFSNIEIPKEYSYMDYLSPVIDQGRASTCVPSSISAHLNWNINVDSGSDNHTDNSVGIMEIYMSRPDNMQKGMCFKDALYYLRHTGCHTSKGIVKIRQYALVDTIESLKKALVMNGPCVCGMMVYNMGAHFWDKKVFEAEYGGHATAIVGYTKDGFIIRNSWGVNWANKGYTLLPYKDFDTYVLECWTIID